MSGKPRQGCFPGLDPEKLRIASLCRLIFESYAGNYLRKSVSALGAPKGAGCWRPGRRKRRGL